MEKYQESQGTIHRKRQTSQPILTIQSLHGVQPLHPRRRAIPRLARTSGRSASMFARIRHDRKSIEGLADNEPYKGTECVSHLD
jgi:hypothetical protein